MSGDGKLPYTRSHDEAVVKKLEWAVILCHLRPRLLGIRRSNNAGLRCELGDIDVLV
jgi:hypothetical protein